jgi:uncharacterized metal-binding protein YceD (DUF177 family)
MSSLLDWSYRTTQIPEAGLQETRSASSTERAAVAQSLEILSCETLVSDFRISASGQGRYRLAGKLQAQVTQSCVVTLEPIQQRVDGVFDVEFWPPGSLPGVGEEEVEALSAAEIEPIEHGTIDVGRIIFETLSSGLDPYPRTPGAEFHPNADEVGSSASGPFAALQKLKDRR